MKKYISLLIATALCASCAAVFTSCGKDDDFADIEYVAEYSKEFEGTTIDVFNWGEYISDGSEGSLDVNLAFEELTGIKVNYTTFESNEDMYVKLKSGSVSYDIIIPSDYMIDRLISENMVQEIDLSKIPNYKYITDDYKGLAYDPEDKYSVAYTGGMVGLIYNTKMVSEAPTSWNVMWDEQYKDDILMFNNSRDAFAIAQFVLGQDINTTNTADWDAAANLLKEQKPLVQKYVMDEVFNKMEGSNAAIAPYYAGDFLTMQEVNPDLAFVYPQEGTNLFVDAMCIPSSAQHYEAALMYINFMLEPEIALANAEYICYSSPHSAVLKDEDYSLKDNEFLYPSAEVKANTQVFTDIDSETRSYYESLWEELKLS